MGVALREHGYEHSSLPKSMKFLGQPTNYYQL
jgi:hypothetical protein